MNLFLISDCLVTMNHQSSYNIHFEKKKIEKNFFEG